MKRLLVFDIETAPIVNLRQPRFESRSKIRTNTQPTIITMILSSILPPINNRLQFNLQHPRSLNTITMLFLKLFFHLHQLL